MSSLIEFLYLLIVTGYLNLFLKEDRNFQKGQDYIHRFYSHTHVIDHF
jgi:hypothetical protein